MVNISTIVQEQFKKPIDSAQRIQLQIQSSFQATIEDVEFILHSLVNNEIRFKSTSKIKEDKTSVTSVYGDDEQSKLSQQKKKRGQTKGCLVELQKLSLSEFSKDDLLGNSSSSRRTRRAAAQTADEKLAEVQIVMKAIKPRRSTDFDEGLKKQGKVSSPPPKSRKTRKKQSAGSDSSDNINQAENNKNRENLVTAGNPRDLVKKRIEDFEKMKKGVEKCEEQTVIGRVTRLTRKKAVPTSLESQSSTLNDGTSKGIISTPTEKTQPSALVQRQAAEEVERKKQEVRLRRQAKEEIANKKKEKILKATSEETRRKREEKLQKVAAAREAAEREKNLLAAKAEKEKEEKMQQMAAEREKHKEEQLKKKLQMQQKAQEHEERRRQDEEARMAKRREQEEEHKRILAIKEREMELQKQQKVAELRLAEAEKAKLQQQGSKLAKLALVNNANAKLQQGMKTVSQPPAQSYELTPAREDRPLLNPKSENDYGIDDANSGDSSEEESHPKKIIPLWAHPKTRRHLLLINSLLPKDIWPLFMESNSIPDINKIFVGKPMKKRIRTSSAVWNTPPLSSHNIYNNVF